MLRLRTGIGGFAALVSLACASLLAAGLTVTACGGEIASGSSIGGEAGSATGESGTVGESGTTGAQGFISGTGEFAGNSGTSGMPSTRGVSGTSFGATGASGNGFSGAGGTSTGSSEPGNTGPGGSSGVLAIGETGGSATGGTSSGPIPVPCSLAVPDKKICPDGSVASENETEVNGQCAIEYTCNTVSNTQRCTGALPQICEVCSSGLTACAHFVIENGQCTVQICPPAPVTPMCAAGARCAYGDQCVDDSGRCPSDCTCNPNSGTYVCESTCSTTNTCSEGEPCQTGTGCGSGGLGPNACSTTCSCSPAGTLSCQTDCGTPPSNECDGGCADAAPADPCGGLPLPAICLACGTETRCARYAFIGGTCQLEIPNCASGIIAL